MIKKSIPLMTNLSFHLLVSSKIWWSCELQMISGKWLRKTKAISVNGNSINQSLITNERVLSFFSKWKHVSGTSNTKVLKLELTYLVIFHKWCHISMISLYSGEKGLEPVEHQTLSGGIYSGPMCSEFKSTQHAHPYQGQLHLLFLQDGSTCQML